MTRFFRRLADIAVTVAGLTLLVLIVMRVQMANEETITGAVRIIDGDTLVLSGRPVRLSGIDAPELHQTCMRADVSWACGMEALQQLRLLADAGPVTCITNARDKYDRLLGVCRSGGDDLNSAMVASGFAVAFGRYEHQEASARRDRLGLWAGTFDLPKHWRATHGTGSAPAAADGGALGFLRRIFLSKGEEGAANGDG